MNSRRVGANNEQAVRNINGSCVLQSEERLVEMAFEYLKVISDILRKEFGLYNRS
jgi:3-deoxy-D-manno-octulosonic acid (KDO) 8-phosphate synthase